MYVISFQCYFTQFLVIDWGWYYLSIVLDDYSRYILAYKLSPTMNAQDAEDTLKVALAKAEIDMVKVYHKLRLLSDNGLAYRSADLVKFFKERGANISTERLSSLDPGQN